MREYIEYVAQTRAPLGLLGKLRLRYINWRLRRDMRRLLSQLNDYQLNDIGLTRHELIGLIGQPRDCDLRWEIGKLSGYPDRLMHLAGSNPQSRTPERGANWKSESPA